MANVWGGSKPLFFQGWGRTSRVPRKYIVATLTVGQGGVGVGVFRFETTASPDAFYL